MLTYQVDSRKIDVPKMGMLDACLHCTYVVFVFQYGQL